MSHTSHKYVSYLYIITLHLLRICAPVPKSQISRDLSCSSLYSVVNHK